MITAFSSKRAIWVGAAIALLVALALLAGCAGAPTPIPDADGEDAAAYVNRCGACHSVPHPKRHDMAAWKVMLDLMDQRIAERNMAPLEGEDRERVLRYLETHAK